jgi:hypothetical protein
MIFEDMVRNGIVIEENFKDDNDNKKYRSLAVTLLNMIMSRHWSVVPIGLKDYNGLYLKYIEKSDVCAVFEYRSKKSFVSHAGIPEASQYFTNYLGLKLNNSVNIKPIKTSFYLCTVVESLNKNIKDSLSTALKKKSAELLRSEDIILHLIKMSAASGEHKHTYELAAYNFTYELTTNSAMSPIVGFIAPSGRKKNLFYEGGYVDIPNIEKFNITSGKKQLEFNIYGHQPRGLAPEVKKFGETWHVCMDVSKIDGNTTFNSYALMIIPKIGKPTFFGKIWTGNKKIEYYESINSANIKENTIQTYNYNIDIDSLDELQKNGIQIKADDNFFAYKIYPQSNFRTIVVFGTSKDDIIAHSKNLSSNKLEIYKINNGGSIIHKLIKTNEYVSISPSIKRLVYKNKRNTKYIKYKGKFERLTDVLKKCKK